MIRKDDPAYILQEDEEKRKKLSMDGAKEDEHAPPKQTLAQSDRISQLETKTSVLKAHPGGLIRVLDEVKGLKVSRRRLGPGQHIRETLAKTRLRGRAFD